MALPEPLQALWKVGLVRDALTRIGELDTPPLEPLLSPVPHLAYRNRAELALAVGAHSGVTVGFHSAGHPQEVVDVERCAILEEPANRVLATAREFLSKLEVGLVEQARASTEWRFIVRYSKHSGRLVVVLRETGRPFPEADKLAAFITDRHAEVSGVLLVRAQPGHRGGARVSTLRGQPWLEERAAGAVFRVPASSFLQVSAAGLEALLTCVIRCAGDVKGAQVLDLYGGVGSFSFGLAAQGARVCTVCDADRDAIQSGKRTARRAGRDKLRFVHDTVGRYLGRLDASRPKPDLVVANPPRAGLGRRVVRGIIALAPPRIVLVSCDPATLARDLKWLVAADYTVDRVIPIDLFPQTAHIETITQLSKH
jgi:23S rRNA (uracil-5-)-methyltransferase RumA